MSLPPDAHPLQAPPTSSWWGLSFPGLDEQRTPLFHAPALVKRVFVHSKFEAQLGCALGRGEIPMHDREAALLWAKQGASGWAVWGHRDGTTHLQNCVELGWLEVADALLENDQGWRWQTPWGKRLIRQHLAGLWFFVSDPLSVQWLEEKCSLNDLPLLSPQGKDRIFYWLAQQLGQKGLIDALVKVHDLLRPHMQKMLTQNMDARRWKEECTHALLLRHPQVISSIAYENMPWAHLLFATKKGQQVLKQARCTAVGLTSNGNSAWVAWCLWPALMHLPDSPEEAMACLEAASEFGVEVPSNPQAAALLEKIDQEGRRLMLWWLRAPAVPTRLEMLKVHMQQQVLQQSTPSIQATPLPRRL